MKLTTTINGEQRTLEIEPGALLLDALREHGYQGVKRGCEAGTCGSCVVLVNGVPKFSCMMMAGSVEGSEVTTIEALGSPSEPHPIMQAFAEEAGIQCGYCTPGMLLSAKALLDQTPDPDEQQVKVALDGHLCRCTGYVKQLKAVLKAAQLMKGEQK